MNRHFSALALALTTLTTLASPLFAAGVAAIKEQSFHADDSAKVFIYQKRLDTGAPFIKFEVGTRTLTYDRAKVAATVDVPDSVPETITEEAHLKPLRDKLAEMNTFATRFPAARPSLEKSITSVEQHINRFDGGSVRHKGKWITRQEFDEILGQMSRDTEKLKEEERQLAAQRAAKRAEQEAFAAQQRAKGLEEFNGVWIPRDEAIRRAKFQRDTAEAVKLVDAKSIRQSVYGIYQVLPDGMLIQIARGSIKQAGVSATICYLTGANTATAADGDLYKGDLFWCGNYSYNSTEGFVRTVNAYTLDRETAIRLARATLNGNAPEPPPLAKTPPANPSSVHPALTGAKSFGSGFFVGTQGHFVTNAHVVGTNTTVDILHQGSTLRATVVQSNPQLDLALLKVEKPVRGVEIATTLAPTGQDVFAVGFPQPEIQGVEIKLTKGIISSQKGFRDDANHYQVDAAVQPGNSGGPLCDKHGRVFGVLVAMLDPGATQNVNYAIKGTVLINFLRPHGIRSGNPDPNGSSGPHDGTVQAVTSASGLVITR